MTNIQIIILAAGAGSRMNSDIPKVMHKIHGKPMIEYVLENAFKVSENIIIVSSRSLRAYVESNASENIKAYLSRTNQIDQSTPQGTGHAVQCALSSIDSNRDAIVIFGDNPMITSDIIINMRNELMNKNVSVLNLAIYRDEPSHYGRLVVDSNDNFIKIVEFKDANQDEREIKLCNSGIMAFKAGFLNKYLNYIKNNNIKNEYYLTDLVEIAKSNGENVSYIVTNEIIDGVNDYNELLHVEKLIKSQVN